MTDDDVRGRIDARRAFEAVVLRAIFDLSAGDRMTDVSQSQLAASLDAAPLEIDAALERLADRGLVEFVVFETVALTANGVEFVEALIAGERRDAIE